MFAGTARTFWASVLISAVYGSDGQTARLLHHYVRDITERRKDRTVARCRSEAAPTKRTWPRAVSSPP